MSYMGRTGYLATVTSKEEDVFLNTLSGGQTGWLGGTILENSGMEVDASDGIEGNLLYYNWARGTSSYEPNNVTYDLSYLSQDYEACLTTLTVAGNMGKQGTSFSWNDKNYGMTGTGVWYPKGYFVEYGNQTIGDVGSSSVAYKRCKGPLYSNEGFRRKSE